MEPEHWIMRGMSDIFWLGVTKKTSRNLIDRPKLMAKKTIEV